MFLFWNAWLHENAKKPLRIIPKAFLYLFNYSSVVIV